MHVGHARTFVEAWRRAESAGGSVVLRIEDLDPLRCRDEWTERAIDDLAWLGVRWAEGPLYQSRRPAVYEGVWRTLLDGGHMVFLLYEGVRGRPANEKVVLGLHMAGFAFIISLMVFVIGLDIQRWILT